MPNTSNEPVVQALRQVLADTYALQLKTQNYHWNVVGPTFKSLHELFEEQYRALFESVDEVAERIRALGAYAPGSFEEFGKATKIKPPQEGIAAKEMVRDLLDSHKLAAKGAAECMEISDRASDMVTNDMMIGRVAFHDKTAWMLQSVLANGGAR